MMDGSMTKEEVLEMLDDMERTVMLHSRVRHGGLRTQHDQEEEG